MQVQDGPSPGAAIAVGLAAVLTAAATTATPVIASAVSHKPSAFEASIGLTRSEVEARFHEIDAGHTVFKAAAAVKGVPRVLGQDRGLYTIVEINGNPEVVNVQLLSLLDTQSKTILEDQVRYDSLACGLLADVAAQNWCTGRILNTNSRGLVTASKSATFGVARITVKTFQAGKVSSPPVVSVDVTAI
jgi:hypothetical protein